MVTLLCVLALVAVMKAVYPLYIRLVYGRDQVDTSVSTSVEMTDHELRSAIQDAGRLWRASGALQEPTFLPDERETRSFRVVIRPFSGSLLMWDHRRDGDYPDDEYERHHRGVLVDGDEDTHTVSVSFLHDVFHSLSLIDFLNEGRNWKLWASEYLPDDVISELDEVIVHAVGVWMTMTNPNELSEQVLFRYETFLDLPI